MKYYYVHVRFLVPDVSLAIAKFHNIVDAQKMVVNLNDLTGETDKYFMSEHELGEQHYDAWNTKNMLRHI